MQGGKKKNTSRKESGCVVEAVDAHAEAQRDDVHALTPSECLIAVPRDTS